MCPLGRWEESLSLFTQHCTRQEQSPSLYTGILESTNTHMQHPFFQDARSWAPNTPALATGRWPGLPKGLETSLNQRHSPTKVKTPCDCAAAHPAHLPGPLCAGPVLRGGRGNGHGCYIGHLRLAQWAVGAWGRDRLMYCVRGRRVVTWIHVNPGFRGKGDWQLL